MEFKKYNSIENTYREKHLFRAQTQLDLKNKNFVVSEKIHGSCFAFYYDGEEMRVAKRSSLLPKENNFFKSSDMLERYRENIETIYRQLKSSKYPEMEVLRVAGEYFGGVFQHPDVEPDNNFSKVQKGIMYSPKHEFMCFDIFIDNVPVDHNTCHGICYFANLPHVPILFVGSFEDALKVQNDMDSLVPEKYGYPKLENNVMEGTVIKPSKPLFFNDGCRLILKNKNEKWSEKSKEPKEPRQQIELTPIQESIYNEIAKFISENRLNNVISKIGEIKWSDFGKVLGLYVKDVWEDVQKEEELSKALNILDKPVRKKINKMVQHECSLTQKQYFNKEI